MQSDRDNPLISVVMSVYNDAAHLPEAIESILAQTLGDFEFLIVDDGSSDDSWRIIQSYTKLDTRVKPCRRPERMGLTKNLNFLLRSAKGRFVARMDGNDVSLPTRLEREVLVMIGEQVDLVWCNAVYIDEQGNQICERYQPSVGYTFAALGRENYVVHPSVMFRNEVVLGLGGYDEEYRTGQDGDLWLRMKRNGCTFAVIDEPLLQYRVEKDDLTARRLGYSNDMNFEYAKLCLRNRQRARSLKYIRAVQAPLHKTHLIIRLLVGEHLVQFLKRFKPYDYQQVHKQ